MVDHTEANKQTISKPTGNSLSPNFWTETLNRLGLESPGYQEVFREMREKYSKKNGK